jgi:hypothetical protein
MANHVDPSGRRQSVEILPLLREKYPHYIRPDITSVRFGQTADRCYLEVHTQQLVGGHLRDETIKRTDLAFISGDGDQRFFDPARSVRRNAASFVNDLDEVSIINCTDLFSDEGASMIVEHWGRSGRVPPRKAQ